MGKQIGPVPPRLFESGFHATSPRALAAWLIDPCEVYEVVLSGKILSNGDGPDADPWVGEYAVLTRLVGHFGREMIPLVWLPWVQADPGLGLPVPRTLGEAQRYRGLVWSMIDPARAVEIADRQGASLISALGR